MKHSTTEIEISGLNLERKLNLLNKHNITVYNVKRIEKKRCIIVVDYEKKQQVIDLIGEKWYNDDGTVETNLPDTKDKGLIAVKNWAVKHIAIAVLFVLIIPLFCVSSMFCARVDIDSTMDYNAVYACVEQCGFGVGKSLTKLNYDSLENYLVTTLDVSYATVKRRGSVLYIKLYDKTNFDGGIDLTKKYDIVSKFDGVITNLVVVQGTPLVKVGDTVKTGQTLIEGKRTFNDGTYVDVRAIGEVFADVTVSQTIEFTGETRELVRSGANLVRTTVKVGEIETSKKDIPYNHCEIVESVTYLYPFNIRIAKQTVYELVEVTKIVQFDDVVEELKSTALAEATSNLFFTVSNTEYIIVKNKSVTVVLAGNIKINAENLQQGAVWE